MLFVPYSSNYNAIFHNFENSSHIFLLTIPTNLKDVPSPILIGLVACDVIEVPETLDGFGSEEVMGVV